MSIFPGNAQQAPEHLPAVPLQEAPERKPHRFDAFARKMGAAVLETIRVTLSIFAMPDKAHWPTERLLKFLKGAEDLAREMLQDIASKITITAAQPCERRTVITPPHPAAGRAPYFQLSVETYTDDYAGDGCDASLKDAGGETAEFNARQIDPPPVSKSDAQASDAATLLQRRLTALEDVLQHPGRHAARMARALPRHSS